MFHICCVHIDISPICVLIVPRPEDTGAYLLTDKRCFEYDDVVPLIIFRPTLKYITLQNTNCLVRTVLT